MKEVGIVICNYNKSDKVLACIQSILENKFRDFDLYVVDNASTDDSVAAIEAKYPDALTLLKNTENLGGSGGFNTGLRAAYAQGYPFLMCVDNDALLDENAIGALYDFLGQHPEVGIAGSKIYHTQEPDFVQNFGQTINFEEFYTEVPYLGWLEDGSMPDFVYTDAVPGCSMMFRREVIDTIGFWPEENFLYWDDTSWCYEAGLHGFKTASVGASAALHEMGAKKEDVNTFPTYYAWRNWIRFFLHYTPEEEWEKMCSTFLGSIFSVCYEGVHKGEKNRAATVMFAYDDAIHGVTGKAGPNRIFDIDTNYKPYELLFKEADCIYLNENGYPHFAAHLKEIAEKLGAKVEWIDHREPYALEVQIVESIFQLNDLSLAKIYVDVEGCILRSEDDALDVINYNYARRTFIQANLPVFLEACRKLTKTKQI